MVIMDPNAMPITQFLIFRCRPGIAISQAGTRFDAPHDYLLSLHTRLQSLYSLISILKPTPGLLRQHWGHQVENPSLFVLCIEWSSLDAYHSFCASDTYRDFSTAPWRKDLFEPDVKEHSLITRWYSPHRDVTQALKAPITEVAFFSLVNGTAGDVKLRIERALEPVNEAVQRVGKAVGAAIGWSTQEPNLDISNGDSDYLCGIYGYNNLEDHMRWREQPEHEMAVEIFADLEKQGLCLRVLENVPGIDPQTGYFHVRFEEFVG